MRIVRCWANDMAVVPKEGQDADVVLPIDLGKRLRQRFSINVLGSGEESLPAAGCDMCGHLATRGSGNHATRAFWQLMTVRLRGGWQGSRAVHGMFVLRLEFALSKSDELAPHEITRISLQDDMTFLGSAAALNRSWTVIEGTLADAGHRLRGYKCGGVGASGCEDTELPPEVRNLCLKVPRKRHGVSLLGSGVNTQQSMHVGLGQPAEAPTQTIERVEQALATLQGIERFACDQHDHVSFSKARMLMRRGVAHALDHDFRLVPPAVMAPAATTRRKVGLRQTLLVLLGSAVSELAWERAKRPTCFGGLGTGVAQMGFAASGNVLVDYRLAHGRHVEHLRRAEQTAPGAASGGGNCSGRKG